MANFLRAINKIIDKYEGGFQKKEDDNGNWTGGKKGIGVLVGTNYGISAPQLAGYLGRQPTEADMRNMTREMAIEIYRRNFWLPIHGDEIKSEGKADQILDMAVNAGVGTAIILAHRDVGLVDSTKMTKELLDILNNRV